MRKYTEQMAEISGFGGSYEEGCRSMVLAGLDWLDAHPGAEPKFSVYKNVYGLVNENNSDAKELSNVVAGAEPDCTGAMHHAAILHVLHIMDAGWEKYVEEMILKRGVL